MELEEMKNILENVLFVSDAPLGLDKFIALFEGKVKKEQIESALQLLGSDYKNRGLEIAEVAEGWRIQTRAEYAGWITNFFKAVRGQKLSRASLEALAIIAYRQPITRAEVDEIRGVDSGGVLRGLVDKSLVKTVGRRKSPGRPMMYGTTRRFLEYFGLARLADLPTMEEFEKELDARGFKPDQQEPLALGNDDDNTDIETDSPDGA